LVYALIGGGTWRLSFTQFENLPPPLYAVLNKLEAYDLK